VTVLEVEWTVMLLVVQASSPQWLVISAKYLRLGSHAVAIAWVKQSQVSDTGDDMHLKAKNVELTAVSVIFEFSAKRLWVAMRVITCVAVLMASNDGWGQCRAMCRDSASVRQCGCGLPLHGVRQWLLCRSVRMCQCDFGLALHAKGRGQRCHLGSYDLQHSTCDHHVLKNIWDHVCNGSDNEDEDVADHMCNGCEDNDSKMPLTTCATAVTMKMKMSQITLCHHGIYRNNAPVPDSSGWIADRVTAPCWCVWRHAGVGCGAQAQVEGRAVHTRPLSVALARTVTLADAVQLARGVGFAPCQEWEDRLERAEKWAMGGSFGEGREVSNGRIVWRGQRSENVAADSAEQVTNDSRAACPSWCMSDVVQPSNVFLGATVLRKNEFISQDALNECERCWISTHRQAPTASDLIVVVCAEPLRWLTAAAKVTVAVAAHACSSATARIAATKMSQSSQVKSETLRGPRWYEWNQSKSENWPLLRRCFDGQFPATIQGNVNKILGTLQRVCFCSLLCIEKWVLP
jgi:hypothetical protein